MVDHYSVAVLRDRNDMLEEQLDHARKQIRELEDAAAITERALLKKAAFRYSGIGADISLETKRVHKYISGKMQEASEYHLSIDGIHSPLSIHSTDIAELATKIDA